MQQRLFLIEVAEAMAVPATPDLQKSNHNFADTHLRTRRVHAGRHAGMCKVTCAIGESLCSGPDAGLVWWNAGLVTSLLLQRAIR
jgi:hypothetical protein